MVHCILYRNHWFTNLYLKQMVEPLVSHTVLYFPEMDSSKDNLKDHWSAYKDRPHDSIFGVKMPLSPSRAFIMGW
ncbi:hypothetical protein PM082_006494 [Marasmius tenuissimus]|nr:hypothetical protein PM082_006494 [Marasmius tenuissimus]